MSPRRGSWWIVAVLVAAIVTPASADEVVRAQRLRRAGLGIIGAGIGLDLAGAGLLFAGFGLPSCAFALGAPESGRCAPPNDGTGNEATATALFWSGLAISLAGDLVHIAGIATWSVGAARVKRFQRATAAR